MRSLKSFSPNLERNFVLFLFFFGSEVITQQQGLAVEKEEMLKGVTSSALYDLGTSLPAAAYGSIPAPRTTTVDFRQALCSK